MSSSLTNGSVGPRQQDSVPSIALRVGERVEGRRLSLPFADYVILAISYVAVMCLTSAHFMADTIFYAQQVLDFSRDKHWLILFEFGHLFWRLLGYLIFMTSKPVLQFFFPRDPIAQIIVALIAISWLSGLACVLLLYNLARLITRQHSAGLIAGFALLFTDAFLNYSHAGSSYIPGLASLLVGVRFVLRRRDATSDFWRIALPAAVAFAFSVLLWLPYAFAIPAAVTTVFLISPYTPHSRRIVLLTLATCLFIGTATYGFVVLGLGIQSIDGLSKWIAASAHGHLHPQPSIETVRLIFSLPRSFINMGRDGVLFKRYLVHDVYAPESLPHIVRLSFWKMAFFYVLAAMLCLESWRSPRGKEMLAILLTACIPLFVFAVFIFEAGSIERYLPMFPFALITAECVLFSSNVRRLSKWTLLSFLVIMSIVNLLAMSRHTLHVEREQVVARISELEPLLKPTSVVIAIDGQDDVATFPMTFPLDPLVRTKGLQTYYVLQLGNRRVESWRENFAFKVFSTWRRGGDVWLSTRLVSPTPRREWNWVEGEDRRVRWVDLPNFFRQFELGRVAGGADGFVLLAESRQNRQILTSLIK